MEESLSGRGPRAGAAAETWATTCQPPAVFCPSPRRGPPACRGSDVTAELTNRLNANRCRRPSLGLGWFDDPGGPGLLREGSWEPTFLRHATPT